MFTLDPALWKLYGWISQQIDRLIDPRPDGDTSICLERNEQFDHALTFLGVLASDDAQADNRPTSGKHAVIIQKVDKRLLQLLSQSQIPYTPTIVIRRVLSVQEVTLSSGCITAAQSDGSSFNVRRIYDR